MASLSLFLVFNDPGNAFRRPKAVSRNNCLWERAIKRNLHHSGKILFFISCCLDRDPSLVQQGSHGGNETVIAK